MRETWCMPRSLNLAKKKVRSLYSQNFKLKVRVYLLMEKYKVLLDYFVSTEYFCTIISGLCIPAALFIDLF